MLSPESRERIIKSDNSLSVYLGLLGLEKPPLNPEDFPKEFFLPSGFMGPIRDARFKSNLDGFERSGYIKWDPKKRILIHKKMKIISQDYSYAKLVLPFFESPVLHYHTHPNGTSLPSNQDIYGLGINAPLRSAHISIVIGENDITALMRSPNVFKIRNSENKDIRESFSMYSEGLNASLSRDNGLVLFKGQDTPSGTVLKRVAPITFEQYYAELPKPVG